MKHYFNAIELEGELKENTRGIFKYKDGIKFEIIHSAYGWYISIEEHENDYILTKLGESRQSIIKKFDLRDSGCFPYTSSLEQLAEILVYLDNKISGKSCMPLWRVRHKKQIKLSFKL